MTTYKINYARLNDNCLDEDIRRYCSVYSDHNGAHTLAAVNAKAPVRVDALVLDLPKVVKFWELYEGDVITEVKPLNVNIIVHDDYYRGDYDLYRFSVLRDGEDEAESFTVGLPTFDGILDIMCEENTIYRLIPEDVYDDLIRDDVDSRGTIRAAAKYNKAAVVQTLQRAKKSWDTYHDKFEALIAEIKAE